MPEPIIPNEEDWVNVGLPDIPTEEVLNGYEEVYPGAKSILLDEAQKEAEHRVQMQRLKEFSLWGTIIRYLKQKIGV